MHTNGLITIINTHVLIIITHTRPDNFLAFKNTHVLYNQTLGKLLKNVVVMTSNMVS